MMANPGAMDEILRTLQLSTDDVKDEMRLMFQALQEQACPLPVSSTSSCQLPGTPLAALAVGPLPTESHVSSHHCPPHFSSVVRVRKHCTSWTEALRLRPSYAT